MQEKPTLFWFDDEWPEGVLELALLKENAAYRKFWAKVGSVALREVNALADENPDGEMKKPYHPYLDHVCAGLRDLFHIVDFRKVFCDNKEWQQALKVLDPYQEETPYGFWPMILFGCPDAVRLVSHGGVIQEFEGLRGKVLRADQVSAFPSLRLLAVDLSRKKSEILREIAQYIDEVTEAREEGLIEQNELDRPDKSRAGKPWQQLEVWRLRRQKKSFLEIHKLTGLRVEAAKKAFARAYELIEGRRYEPETFRKLYDEIASPELKRTCSSCHDRDTCSDLCPDVLAFINQDYTGLYERLAPARK